MGYDVPDRAIQRLRAAVVRAAQDPAFVHHAWFVPYHLEIVERLAAELCQRYPAADRGLVLVLVWLHDYGKIVDSARQYEMTAVAGRPLLRALGFPDAYVERALAYVHLLDRKQELERAPIEVQIVSSADGAAHLVGPFYALWWYEHPQKPIVELLEENRRKAYTDWHQKIVLPEVRAAFAQRYHDHLERCGAFPSAFIATD